METICPDRAHWQELLDGLLPDDRQGVLAAHLDACPSCRQTLDELAGGNETVGLTARRLEQSSAETGPALGRAMHDLYGLPRPGASTATVGSGPDAALDFLDPPQEPEHLGRLGRYDVTAVVGWGGMGVVLHAIDATLRRTVALKVIAPRLATNPTARQRFLREAQAAAAIRHEHVVTIHAVEEAKSLPYIVMEYIPGLSLQQLVSRTGPLPLAQIVRIGQQVAAGLAAAHALGVTHRDIKPANILLESMASSPSSVVKGRQAAEGRSLTTDDGPRTTDFRVKITDFGLARAANDPSLTQHGVLIGTPEYMAPEQARGERQDHRADLFSLGGVFYTMCTGRPPFRAGTVLGMLRLISEETPPPIRELNPQIPDWLSKIVEKLLAKAPADRFQSAAEVAALLDRHPAAPSQAPSPAPVLPAPKETPSAVPGTFWRPLAVGIGLLSLVGGMCLLAVMLSVAALLFPLWWDWQDAAPKDRRDADVVREANRPPAPAELPQPRDPNLRLILVALKADNAFTRNEAATRLEKMLPIEDERAAVAGALQPLLNDPDHFTRQAMIRALGVWGTPQHIPALVKMFEHDDVFTRRAAITALGNIRDERSAEAIAGRMEDTLNREAARQALLTLGPLSEKATARLIDHKDWAIRLTACQILKVIGTKQSIPALETALKDSNNIVAGEAKSALQMVHARDLK
jgi:serine/threonine protein kinase